ncbi:MAG: DNA-binding transcriptional regulator OxyR [Halobacteriovorax sp.]|nr:DNA-binding transcriptional regulator OxyR [Halobacteriovorax sp.]
MPTITQLEYLLAVDRHRHFGKAAEECHVTQPSLSMQLQKLEEELGIIAFDRSKKPIMATEQGKLIIDQAKIVLNEHKKLGLIALDKEAGLRGEFKIAVIPTLSPYVIPLFLHSFAKKYPEVELTIEEHQTDEIIELLARDKIDAGLLVTPLKNNHIIERVLFYEPFYLYASSNSPVAKKKTVKESDLNENEVWLLDEGHCFRNQVIKFCSIKGKAPTVLKNVRFQSGNLETLKNMVRTQGGYTFLPYLATLGLSASEKSKMLRAFQNPAPSREVSIVHSRSFLKENIIEALQNEIIACLPSDIRSLKSSKLQVIDI